MVNLYFTLIKNHLKILSDAPTKFQTAVSTKLTAAGLDSSGNAITSTTASA
jgi:hypothetical protein